MVIAFIGLGSYANPIKIVSYTEAEPFEDELIYGYSTKDFIGYPGQGQSIRVDRFSIAPDTLINNVHHWTKKDFHPGDNFIIWIE